MRFVRLLDVEMRQRSEAIPATKIIRVLVLSGALIATIAASHHLAEGWVANSLIAASYSRVVAATSAGSSRSPVR